MSMRPLDSEYPELRIIFKVKPGYDSKSYNFFGSYNISGIWHRPNVKGVKVMWNGTDKNSVTLEKLHRSNLSNRLNKH